VNVTDGALNLDFINIENFAKVSALEIISKTVMNNAPVLSYPVPDQNVILGSAFSLSIAANTFSDPDGDLLTYT
ncbi:hypothetical protein, partial [Anditalea andensis]|uniref:hypothetical protein n=1 Tax=Anditalea andensis TaxID=1048983 RepID=UPI000550ED34